MFTLNRQLTEIVVHCVFLVKLCYNMEGGTSESSPSSSKTLDSEVNKDEYHFLSIKDEPTSSKPEMKQIHKNTCDKLSKLKGYLKNESTYMADLVNLYNKGCFQVIEDSLSNVTFEFLKPQLKYDDKSDEKWSKDKTLGLSLYKRSPKLYRYLSYHFLLPSVDNLKSTLTKIPFPSSGPIECIFDYLRLEMLKYKLDPHCTLIFQQIALSPHVNYDKTLDQILGFEYLVSKNEHGPTPADSVFVFMLRGVAFNYKIPVAYYFTGDSFSASDLKDIIVILVKKLHEVGFKVVATVCDHSSTNKEAVSILTKSHDNNHFVVNGERVYTIFDAPSLLKSTLESLMSGNIEYESGKFAKIEDIRNAFNCDQKVDVHKTLPKITEAHFTFDDEFQTAAHLLSHSVASAIQTFHKNGNMPATALHTSEFVAMVDELFDSLNSNLKKHDSKKLRCPLTGESPHETFWASVLPKLSNWTKNSSEGWQVTIKAVQSLWRDLQARGLTVLSLRNLNQEALDNMFAQISQTISTWPIEDDPTCCDFMEALKVEALNNFTTAHSEDGYLGDFAKYLNNLISAKKTDDDESHNDEEEIMEFLEELDLEMIKNKQN
ncbi:unnamed protein product [Brassicogethes aeneus]|uniref:Uncharacterized protein n=1 Tax=Brassicogethes aeneus TaxID=1431903 RepID=A0A9P0BIA0_BRAAE|nr:unnamed protein product [Brassicogethes aeneus]